MQGGEKSPVQALHRWTIFLGKIMEILHGFSFGVEGNYLIIGQDRVSGMVSETEHIEIHIRKLEMLENILQDVRLDPDKYGVHFGGNGDSLE